MKFAPMFCVAIAVSVAAPAICADAYPAKPIKILVGYSAGGAVDIVARAIGQQISAALGQPVIIDNKPGAGANIAVRALIDSAPDGYTLMLAGNSLAANMALFQPPPYDTDRDITPVSLVGRVPVVIAVRADSPYTSLKALVDAAKARPEAVSYASPGNGSTPHLAMELFEQAAGIRLSHIPYKGGAPAITDVLGGQLPVVAMNSLEILPHAQAGKLRVLAVMTAQRSPVLPATPTVAESGYPGFAASVWYGLIAPARTPQPVVDTLHAAVQKALASEELRNRMSAVGGEVTPMTTAQFGTLVKSERQRYEKIVREANIRPD